MVVTDDLDVIHPALTWLSPEVPLSVHLITGSNYAVLIDTGVAAMFGQISDLITRTLPDPRQAKLILNTHAHHDHIGCNAGLSEMTGALVAASGEHAAWHVDLERHFQEFALEHPDLIPDTAQLREEVLKTIDAPRPVDLFITDGQILDLGGGVVLQALSLPGHMPGELGFIERSTKTLILGDSLTGVGWSFFHGYSDVDVYGATLRRLREVIREDGIVRVRPAHYECMSADAALDAIDKVAGGMAAIDSAIRLAARDRPDFTLGEMWEEVSQALHKARDFRGLRVVDAHLHRFGRLGDAREVEADVYRWSAS
jgi:hydroxyacylglutathione hydrolase